MRGRSACAIWAAGERHWSSTGTVRAGRSYRAPNPPAAPGRRRYAILRAVTAISPTDVRAVGYSGGVRSPVMRTLIEHWNGHRRTILPTPNVRSAGGVVNDILFAISGSEPEDVWAVAPGAAAPAATAAEATKPSRSTGTGDAGRASRPQPSPNAPYSRARWSIVSSPAGFSFAAVTTSPDGAAWAVGASGRRPLAARC
jgi:hypothetical protein